MSESLVEQLAAIHAVDLRRASKLSAMGAAISTASGATGKAGCRRGGAAGRRCVHAGPAARGEEQRQGDAQRAQRPVASIHRPTP